MNAQSFNQVVNPVIAVLATTKYNHKKNRQEPEKRTKKPKNFDSLFQTACDTIDDTMLLNKPGCYGKDAKPVVGTVISFNRTL